MQAKKKVSSFCRALPGMRRAPRARTLPVFPIGFGRRGVAYGRASTASGYRLEVRRNDATPFDATTLQGEVA